MAKHTYLVFPVQLAQQAIKDKTVKPLQFYTALKSLYGGQVRKSKTVRDEVCELLSISEKTYYNRLNECYELHWIGSDGEWLFIRGFKHLMNIYGIRSRTCAEFSFKHDLNTFTEFLFSSVTAYLEKAQAKRLRPERQKARSIQGQITPTPYFSDYALMLDGKEKTTLIKNYESFGPEMLYDQLKRPTQNYQPGDLSLTLLSDHFGRSIGYIRDMKKRIVRGKYARVNRNRFKPLPIPANQSKALKMAFPEIAGAIRYQEERLFIQVTDNIKTDLKLKCSRR